MELKRNKKAITLVELIIALTMVSVLMVMMFGVIFKKTKATVLSSTGTFYCWKDWENKLHQRIIYSSGSKVVTESKDDIGECKLDFPKFVTKDANSIKAHIIGGGASGDYYEKKVFVESSNATNPDPDIIAKLKNEANCYKSDTKSYCIKYDKNSFTDLSCDSCLNKSNVLDDDALKKRIIQKCYVELCVSENKCDKWYKVDDPSQYYYNNDINKGNPCPPIKNPDIFGNDYKKALIDIHNKKGIFPKTSLDGEPEYTANSQIKFKVHTASKDTNTFKTIDIADKIDRNTILKISKNDIGNGGLYKPGDSSIYTGRGGDTVLRVKYQGEEIETAPGVEFNNTKSVLRNLNTNLDDDNVRKAIKDPNYYLYASSCCKGKTSECKFNVKNTGIAQLVGLKTPDMPKVDNSCSDTRQSHLEFDTSSNPTGFGLFGYNGFPNELIYKYKPFKNIDIYGSRPSGLMDTTPSLVDSQVSPIQGMGGAIIIQWN